MFGIKWRVRSKNVSNFYVVLVYVLAKMKNNERTSINPPSIGVYRLVELDRYLSIGWTGSTALIGTGRCCSAVWTDPLSFLFFVLCTPISVLFIFIFRRVCKHNNTSVCFFYYSQCFCTCASAFLKCFFTFYELLSHWNFTFITYSHIFKLFKTNPSSWK